MNQTRYNPKNLELIIISNTTTIFLYKSFDIDVLLPVARRVGSGPDTRWMPRRDVPGSPALLLPCDRRLDEIDGPIDRVRRNTRRRGPRRRRYARTVLVDCEIPFECRTREAGTGSGRTRRRRAEPSTLRGRERFDGSRWGERGRREWRSRKEGRHRLDRARRCSIRNSCRRMASCLTQSKRRYPVASTSMMRWVLGRRIRIERDRVERGAS